MAAASAAYEVLDFDREQWGTDRPYCESALHEGQLFEEHSKCCAEQLLCVGHQTLRHSEDQGVLSAFCVHGHLNAHGRQTR